MILVMEFSHVVCVRKGKQQCCYEGREGGELIVVS